MIFFSDIQLNASCATFVVFYGLAATTATTTVATAATANPVRSVKSNDSYG